MSKRSIRLNQLAGSDHIARNYGATKCNNDGTPSPAAFAMDLEKDYFLSNVWLEFFHSANGQKQISGVLEALGKKRTVGPNSKLAVFSIQEALRRCAEVGVLVDIMTTGEPCDPSHAGIFGYVHENDDVAAILAEQVNHQIYSSTGTKISAGHSP